MLPSQKTRKADNLKTIRLSDRKTERERQTNKQTVLEKFVACLSIIIGIPDWVTFPHRYKLTRKGLTQIVCTQEDRERERKKI